jgi:hypothetical protein
MESTDGFGGSRCGEQEVCPTNLHLQPILSGHDLLFGSCPDNFVTTPAKLLLALATVPGLYLQALRNNRLMKAQVKPFKLPVLPDSGKVERLWRRQQGWESNPVQRREISKTQSIDPAACLPKPDLS